jgi:hypothetical protein
MLKYLDPRGHVATPVEAYALNHQFSADGSGTTVGLLANGFPDSEKFLAAVGEAISQRLPAVTIKHWNKGNPTIAAPTSMLDDIRANCDVVIAAYGH